MNERFDPQRFVEAQAPVFETVLRELASGRKRTHWIWFVFPQIAGLGRSAMAQRYAIGSLDEARAYLAHPLLGPRLRQATKAVLAIDGRTAHEIFGSPDDIKVRSSMTLFARADPDEPLFAQALARYFDGQADEATLARLDGAADG